MSIDLFIRCVVEHRGGTDSLDGVAGDGVVFGGMGADVLGAGRRTRFSHCQEDDGVQRAWPYGSSQWGRWDWRFGSRCTNFLETVLVKNY